MFAQNPVIWLIFTVLDLYMYVVIASVVMSWLVNFGVINVYNPMARSVIHALDSLTEPVYRQIRRVIPAVGGLDFSPLIVLIGIQFLERLIAYSLY